MLHQEDSFSLRVDTSQQDGDAGLDRLWVFGADWSTGSPEYTSDTRVENSVAKEGVWNHVVLSFDWSGHTGLDSEIAPKLWLNGERLYASLIRYNEDETIDDLDTNTSGFGYPGHGSVDERCAFKGYMYECALWERVLTDLEARALYEMKYGF